MAPLVARGVLLDVAKEKRLEPDHSITPEELHRAAMDTGVEIRAGDGVLVRTGYGALWSKPEEYLRGAGVIGAGSRWPVEKKVSAGGAHNMAWDVIGPTDPETGVA